MVRVGSVNIGEGQPKICTSVVENDRKAIIAAADILVQRHVDIVEWRIDYYQDVEKTEQMMETLNRLHMSLWKTPLLVTFRTKAEGGQRELSADAYFSLLDQIVESGYADLIDVEIFKEIQVPGEGLLDEAAQQESLQKMQTYINKWKQKVKVVGSYHNFEKTPSVDEMAQILDLIQSSGVDIIKMAMMPRDSMDVLHLMEVTLQANRKYEQPLITMSMGELGVVSRLIGEMFGSSVTFGTLGQESAPGQVPIGHLQEVLRLLHPYYRTTGEKLL